MPAFAFRAPPPRCALCRRPEGLVLAWADGSYAVGVQDRWAVYEPTGYPVLDQKRFGDLIGRPGSRIVTVTLDLNGHCARCAVLHQRGQRPSRLFTHRSMR